LVKLTKEQQSASDAIIDSYKSKSALLTIGGYAGTGKTTLLGSTTETLRRLGAKIAFCTYSGKASTVLKSKINLTADDYCGTIHGLIYRLINKNLIKKGEHIKTELEFCDRGNNLPYDIIILDEASMVNQKVFLDLSSRSLPIIAVGDHGQLPPIKGQFNLMEDPTIRLEKIMRQAEDNPIIKLSIMAREDGKIPYGDFGNGVKKVADGSIVNKHSFSDISSVVLCATNQTRNKINNYARDKLKIESKIPIEGEPVICLMNNHRERIFNGMIGNILNIENHEDFHDTRIAFGDFEYWGYILPEQFGSRYTLEKLEDIDLFDWAYCITVHKSQGSEWDNVLLYEERMKFLSDEDWRRWLYTAVTRAKKRLTIIRR